MNDAGNEWRHFRPNLEPTVGVEIELAVLQPNTFDLGRAASQHCVLCRDGFAIAVAAAASFN